MFTKHSIVKFDADEVRFYKKTTPTETTLWINSADIISAAYAPKIYEHSVTTFDIPEDNNKYGSLVVISAKEFLKLYSTVSAIKEMSVRAVIERMIDQLQAMVEVSGSSDVASTDSTTTVDTIADDITAQTTQQTIPIATKITTVSYHGSNLSVYVDDNNVAYFGTSDKIPGLSSIPMMYDGEKYQFTPVIEIVGSKNDVYSVSIMSIVNMAIHTHMAKRLNQWMEKLLSSPTVKTNTVDIKNLKECIAMYLHDHEWVRSTNAPSVLNDFICYLSTKK